MVAAWVDLPVWGAVPDVVVLLDMVSLPEFRVMGLHTLISLGYFIKLHTPRQGRFPKINEFTLLAACAFALLAAGKKQEQIARPDDKMPVLPQHAPLGLSGFYSSRTRDPPEFSMQRRPP